MLYQPSLIQYIIFWKKDPNSTLKDTKFNLKSIDIDNIYLKDLEIQEEREYIIIHFQMSVKPQQNQISENGWVEVTVKDFKKTINTARKFSDRYFSSRKVKTDGLKHIGNYQLMIAGSESEYWTKSDIDIHKFKIDADGTERSLKLRDIESESKLSIFNKLLFNSKQVIGNKLENLKLKTTIYGLGNNLTEEFHRLPKSFMLDLSFDNKVNDKDARELQEKQFILTTNTVISNFGRLLIYNAKLIDLYKDEYTSLDNQSNKIREEALKLQMKINELLVKKSDITSSNPSSRKSLKKEPPENYQYLGMEENLLLKASRYFSLLTEINHLQASANYIRQEAVSNIDKICQTLGMTPITLLTESSSEIKSLNEVFKQLSDSINYSFQNLKIELEHSQTTIRNTVEILKTFLESEQRIVTQKSSEAINWIVIVFAGLGLADALGNFVVYYLQGGSGIRAMIWFFIIMIPLLMIVLILYFWFFKKPRMLRISNKLG